MVLAPTHGGPSNRALERSKAVFRSVLQNPLQIAWPSVPPNIQNAFLARLVATLENVPPRSRASRKLPHHSGTAEGNGNTTEDTASAHLVIGINSVTRALESQIRLARKHVVGDNHFPNDGPPPAPAQSPVAVVFVCCADVDPTALIDHIPYLVAGCNSPRNATQLIKLIPLPKGSEPTISQLLGVRRAAVVAFRRASLESFQDILDSVPIVSAPWLCPSDTPQLAPTHIKQLRTTAPKDMKAAREQRAEARAAAKKNASRSSRSTRRKPRLTLSTGSESAG